ncbi:hypothetical protein MN116_006856 [Schistosoma mekongi]|uniref:Uncharacterized protein n=1 Tax=Schistosoma mekongi TaxID=38744 RepID=A0AAE1Z9D0_SCHME|nr:hypothetical protein MN116_006856 [Schistosoma mekongi]
MKLVEILGHQQGVPYIGRTDRRNFLRLIDHISDNLGPRRPNNLRNLIARRSRDTRHSEHEKHFLNRQESTSILLIFAKAIAVRRPKHNQCIHKESVERNTMISMYSANIIVLALFQYELTYCFSFIDSLGESYEVNILPLRIVDYLRLIQYI